MPHSFVVTITINLPDDPFESAERLMRFKPEIDALVAKADPMDGVRVDYQSTTSEPPPVVTEKKPRKNAAKVALAAAVAGALPAS